MAIYKRDIVDINLETGNIHRSFLKHSIGYLDQAADHFGIRVLRNGEPVDLTGVTVQGIFMPPQGNPIAITTGNIIEENVAEVVLPQACYNYDGQFCLSIKLVDATNAITGTMRIVDGMVDNTHASGTVAPTETVPTYQEILSVYADMVTALVTVDELDDEVSDLKSAINGIDNITLYDFVSGSVDTNPSGGTINLNPSSSQSYKVAVIPCVEGDLFSLSFDTTGSNTHYYGYIWVDSSNIRIGNHPNSGDKQINVKITAPANAVYLVVQTRKTLTDAYVCKNVSPTIMDSDIQARISSGLFASDMEEVYPFVNGSIDTNPSSGGISIIPTPSSGNSVAIVPCSPNDVFTVSCDKTGSNTHYYPWVFITSAGERLTHSDSGIRVTSELITAPDNAAYLIVQNKDSLLATPYVCKGISPALVKKELDALNSSAFKYIKILSSSDDIDDLSGNGIFRRISTSTPINWPELWPDGISSGAGILLQFSPSASYKIQFYFPAITAKRPDSAFFWRAYITASVWGNFQQVGGGGDSSEGLDLNAIISSYQNESGKYDSSFSFKFTLNRNPVVLAARAIYTGDTAPTIKYAHSVSGGTAWYTSPEYVIGSAIEPVTHEWRIPPKVETCKTCTVTITIPEGTEVDIKDIYLRDDSVNKNVQDGIKFHAHTGFLKLEPTNTIGSFQLAARLGFNSLITIPKFTTDGVGVCFHDDGSIGDLLKWPDGSAITGDDDKPISQYTYEEILQFDAGLKTNSVFAGVKVPLLDDYFRICALCKMTPILSIHPASMFYTTQGSENWPKIKAMTDKYGLTKKLWIKSGNPYVQQKVLEVFGTEIGGMVLIRATSSTWDPLEQAKSIGLVSSDATNVKDSIVPVVFEIYYSVATNELINLGLGYGFRVSVAAGSDKISGAEMNRLMNLGVTEFTQDYHCSMGLDW